jgi:branched-chain amino acid transport system permease protein
VNQKVAGVPRPLMAGVGVVLLTALITQFVVPNKSGGRGVPLAVDFQGLVQGMIAAMLAASLVLLFRTSRIINFGALSFGVPGGLLAFELIRFTSCPFPVAVAMCLVLSAAFGAIAELTFGRRFAKQSRLIFTIATIFISTTLIGVITPGLRNLPFMPPVEERPITSLFGADALRAYLPLSGFNFKIGDFPVQFGFAELFTIELALVALIALGLILRFTQLGMALRSVAENSERASMLGISTGTITTLAWSIAGLFGGIAVLLTGLTGNAGVTQQTAAGATTLLLPLTAAVLARFRSLPIAVLACLVLSVLTSALEFGMSDAAPLVTGGQLVLLVSGLLLQRRDLFRLASAGEGSWRLTAEERPVPRELASLGGVRAVRYVSSAVALIAVAVLPFVANAGVVSQMQSILLLGVVGLSLVILTGWAGQVSLGQYAFVAVGAVVAGGATERGDVPFLLSVPLGMLVASAVAVLVGLPALRVKGLFLGVATFGLAVATSVLLFDRKLFGWLLPGAIPRPEIFISFDSETPFYYLCVAAFLMSLLFVRNLRGSRFGRLLIASRDNDAALQSAGVSIVRTRLMAFAISGGLAGFGGALLAFQLRTVTSTEFDAAASFQLFIYVVLGGISSVAGAMIGVAYLGIQTYFLGNGFVTQYLVTSLPILLLYFAPGGLLAVFSTVRDAALRVVAQRRGLIVPSLFRGQDESDLRNRLTPMSEPMHGAGLAALPRDARWSITSRMHGKAGGRLSADQSIDEMQLFAAAAAAVAADDELNTGADSAATPADNTDLVGTTGAKA